MKMIASEKLSLLLAYLATRRGAGSTSALLIGARNYPGVAVLTHDYRYGRTLKKEAKNIVIVPWVDDWRPNDPLYPLLSADLPLLVDHQALAAIGRDMLKENQELSGWLEFYKHDNHNLLRFNKTTLALHHKAAEKWRDVETAYLTRIVQLERTVARKAAEIARLHQSAKRRRLGQPRKGKKKL